MIVHSFPGRVIRVGNEDCNHPAEFWLEYDAAHDPLAVDLRIKASGEDEIITWTFARELLVGALNSPRPSGSGDVRFRHDGRSVFMCLKNPQTRGHADFWLPQAEVQEFMTLTTEAAAQPQDFVDAAVEALIEELRT